MTKADLIQKFEYPTLYNISKKINEDMVEFVDTTYMPTKRPLKKIMVFKKVLLVNGKYRIIPNYVRYAISKDGEILDILNNKIVKQYKNKNKHYPKCSIYDPEFKCKKEIYIHRLVALAWVKNDDYVKKPVVNHKDGNKLNFKYSNLEWVSYSENNLDAHKKGLTNYGIKCRITNIRTNKKTTFNTLSTAVRFMGYKHYIRKFKLLSRPVNYLYKNKYKLEILDNTPKYATKIKGPYDALNIKTKKVISAKTIRDFIPITKDKFDVIREKIITKSLVATKHNYIYRMKTNKPWSNEIKSYPGKRVLVVLDTTNNTKKIFKTALDASKYYNLTKDIIYYRVKYKKPYKNLYFNYISQLG